MLTNTEPVIEDPAKKICIALLVIDSIGSLVKKMCHVLLHRCFTLPLAQNQFPPMVACEVGVRVVNGVESQKKLNIKGRK